MSGASSTKEGYNVTCVDTGLVPTTTTTSTTTTWPSTAVATPVYNRQRGSLPDSELVKMMKPLDKCSWPKKREDLLLFEETEVGDLAKLLKRINRKGG